MDRLCVSKCPIHNKYIYQCITVINPMDGVHIIDQMESSLEDVVVSVPECCSKEQNIIGVPVAYAKKTVTGKLIDTNTPKGRQQLVTLGNFRIREVDGHPGVYLVPAQVATCIEGTISKQVKKSISIRREPHSTTSGISAKEVLEQSYHLMNKKEKQLTVCRNNHIKRQARMTEFFVKRVEQIMSDE